MTPTELKLSILYLHEWIRWWRECKDLTEYSWFHGHLPLIKNIVIMLYNLCCSMNTSLCTRIVIFVYQVTSRIIWWIWSTTPSYILTKEKEKPDELSHIYWSSIASIISIEQVCSLAMNVQPHRPSGLFMCHIGRKNLVLLPKDVKQF